MRMITRQLLGKVLTFKKSSRRRNAPFVMSVRKISD